MKSLIRKWLIGQTSFNAYTRITTPHKLQQRAWLQVNGLLFDISTTHFILCIEPVVFGVWLPSARVPRKIGRGERLVIYIGGKNGGSTIENPEAKLFGKALEIFHEERGSLITVVFDQSKIYHLQPLNRYLLYYRYYRDKATRYPRFKSFVCSYSYPRRIRVVCFKQGDYCNIFPMDLLGDIHEEERYVFGLRHTNIALEKIISAGKLVVCEFSYQYKDIVYELGKHHSTTPPCLESLDFKTIPSRSFGFPIPVWADSYKEVRITKTFNLGSHMLLWGERVDEVVLRETSDPLYLVHFLHYLNHRRFFSDYELV